MPIYLKYPGCDGSVTAKGYEKWVEIDTCQLGMHRPMESRVGNKSYASSGKLQVSEIHCSKPTDNSSSGLWIQTIQGKFDSKVEIAFVTTVQGGLCEFMKYTLTDTGISSFNFSGHSAGHPAEGYSLNFSKYEFNYKGMDKATQAHPQVGGYDLAKAKSL